MIEFIGKIINAMTENDLSIIAILISILGVLWQLRQEKKLNITNLESKYHEEIFGQYLRCDIPKSRRYVRFTSDNKLSETYSKFTKVLSEMRKSILYYSYRDKDFFDLIDSNLVGLDEYIIELSNKKVQSIEQAKYLIEIDDRISKLYEIIMRKYFIVKK